jgi:hypothetical protein
MRAGKLLLSALEEEEMSEGDECVKEPRESLDAQGVFRHLCRMVAVASRDLMRGAWFCLLGWSGLLWYPADGGRRSITVRAGRITEACWRESGIPVPDDPVPLRRRQRDFDRETFDRLRVLDSQLRRIVLQGSMDHLVLPGGHTLDTRRLLDLYRVL